MAIIQDWVLPFQFRYFLSFLTIHAILLSHESRPSSPPPRTVQEVVLDSVCPLPTVSRPPPATPSVLVSLSWPIVPTSSLKRRTADRDRVSAGETFDYSPAVQEGYVSLTTTGATVQSLSLHQANPFILGFPWT